MKDSLLRQPLPGAGTANPQKGREAQYSAQRAEKTQPTSSEFSQVYQSENDVNNSSESSTNSEALLKTQHDEKISVVAGLNDIKDYVPSDNQTSLESLTVFSETIAETAKSAISTVQSETSVIIDEDTGIIGETIATIKSEENVDSLSLVTNADQLLTEHTIFPDEAVIPPNTEGDFIINTIKSEGPQGETIQDEIFLAQGQISQIGLSALQKEAVDNESGTIKSERHRSQHAISGELDIIEGVEIHAEISEIDLENNQNMGDLDALLDIRSENKSPQALFSNSTHISTGQPLINLGMELAAPTVFSGTNSVSATSQTSTIVPPNIANTIVSTINEALLTAKETPKGVMVQLDPPEMGRVYIDFVFDGDSRVNVVMKADNMDSFNILRERSQDFIQMLTENGFSDVDLSFQRGGTQSDTSDGSNEHGSSYDLAFTETAGDTLEASYQTPLYRINDNQLRLDLRL